MEAGRRGGKEANYVSLFCAHSDQFIICCFRGFIHSIFCFLPQPSPPSGSQRGVKNSQPSTKLQVALKYFTAKRREKKKILRWKTSEKGAPQRGLVQAGDSKLGKAPGASSRWWPAQPAHGHFAAIRRSWRRGAEAACGRGATRKGPGSPRLRAEASRSPLLAPLLSPLSRPPPPPAPWRSQQPRVSDVPPPFDPLPPFLHPCK